jgi:hypothetical protein
VATRLCGGKAELQAGGPPPPVEEKSTWINRQRAFVEHNRQCAEIDRQRCQRQGMIRNRLIVRRRSTPELGEEQNDHRQYTRGGERLPRNTPQFARLRLTAAFCKRADETPPGSRSDRPISPRSRKLKGAVRNCGEPAFGSQSGDRDHRDYYARWFGHSVQSSDGRRDLRLAKPENRLQPSNSIRRRSNRQCLRRRPSRPRRLRLAVSSHRAPICRRSHTRGSAPFQFYAGSEQSHCSPHVERSSLLWHVARGEVDNDKV